MELHKTWIDANGYERQGRDAYVHRTKAEKVLGRKLKRGEQVHHVDGNRANNSNRNLVICPTDKYHKLLHARQRIIELGGVPSKHRYCNYHNRLEDRTKFSTVPNNYDGLHNYCREATNEYRKLNNIKSVFNWKARLNQQYRRQFRNKGNTICQLD